MAERATCRSRRFEPPQRGIACSHLFPIGTRVRLIEGQSRQYQGPKRGLHSHSAWIVGSWGFELKLLAKPLTFRLVPFSSQTPLDCNQPIVECGGRDVRVTVDLAVRPTLKSYRTGLVDRNRRFGERKFALTSKCDSDTLCRALSGPLARIGVATAKFRCCLLLSGITRRRDFAFALWGHDGAVFPIDPTLELETPAKQSEVQGCTRQSF